MGLRGWLEADAAGPEGIDEESERNPSVAREWIVGLGLGVVVVVVATTRGAARRRQRVRCTETGKDVQVRCDPVQAARATFTDEPPRVDDCSRWPERAGCDRACEKDVSP